ncbi:MAG: Gfo/Idh/MocA family protein [Geminicoccaceae bacterium]
MEPTLVGLIGCGNISNAYFAGAGRSEMIKIKACADLRVEAAKAKAEEHGVEAVSVDALLADPDIEIVINLTVPSAHAEVSRSILDAGKHAYGEKPLATRFEDARALMDEAERKGLRVGSAPDTFMGAAHQACRRLIDEGAIGRPVAGTAAVLSHGMEHWHPNPEFFFKPGGGPLLDMGPYYVTQLVNLLGPVERVTAIAGRAFETRTVTSQPLAGHKIAVEVSTTVNGILAFRSGASIALSASWDVWKHKRLPFELYGTDGSLLVPDPNFFGGVPEMTKDDGDWEPVAIDAHPFGQPNREMRSGSAVADYRAIGVIDMAGAIKQGRPHRANGTLALHVLEVLESLERSSVDGRHIAIETLVERPQAVPQGHSEEVFLN